MSTTLEIYPRLNRGQKASWTRIARALTMADANRVWAARLAEQEKAA